MAAPRGRPTDLTPDTHKIIVEAVRDGVPRKYAAMKAGVSVSTMYKWVQRGKKEGTGPYFDFFDALKKADGEAVARNVEAVQTAALATWQAAAWWLERRYPKEFGRREAVSLKTADPKQPAGATVEQLVRALAELGQHRGGGPAAPAVGAEPRPAEPGVPE